MTGMTPTSFLCCGDWYSSLGVLMGRRGVAEADSKKKG